MFGAKLLVRVPVADKPKPPLHISQRALFGEVTSQVISRMADGSVGDGDARRLLEVCDGE